MKLFLSSTSITNEQKDIFSKFVGKSLLKIKFALIENAADPYDFGDKGFVADTRSDLDELGLSFDLIDLRDFVDSKSRLQNLLSSYDVVWFGGGNLHYLRWIMRESGFDAFAKDLLENKVILGGGSAGAIVFGKSLKHYDLVDDSALSPTLIKEGLDLSGITVIPHWGVDEYQDLLSNINELYLKEGVETVLINDSQAVMIEGGVSKLVP